MLPALGPKLRAISLEIAHGVEALDPRLALVELWANMESR
jgi:hypothetical protein